jgi:hypothetical protein
MNSTIQCLYAVPELRDVLNSEVGPMYKLNLAVTHSLKAPGFNPWSL